MENHDTISKQDRLLVNICYLSAFLSPLIGMLVSIFIYSSYKNESLYVGKNAKEALNFHISFFLYECVSGILSIIVIGIFLLMIAFVASYILSIMAVVKLSNNEDFRCPLILRLIK